jgi:hypothetical protein
MRTKPARPILTLLSFLIASEILAAPPPEVRTAGPPPEGLPSDLRTGLVAEGVRTGSLEIWLRASPPLGQAREGLGIALARLVPGALAGVLRLTGGWSDYRGQRIEAGLYTLRYGVEPADGNHMGVSAWRDFFLLVPAADDPGSAAVPAPTDLYALSTKASRTNHPAVLGLFPVAKMQRASGVVNELGQPVLAIPFGELTLGIVIEGKGEI